MGRVHRQQREDQGRRQGSPRSCRPTATPGRRQLFVLGDFANVLGAGPGLGRAVHRQRGASTSTSRRSQGFANQQEAFEAGLFNEDFASATVRRRRSSARDRHGRALPDADRRDRDDRAEQPGQRRRHRRLRRCRPQDARRHRDDDLAAERASTSPRRPRATSSRRRRSSWRSRTPTEGCEVQNDDRRRSGPYVIERLHAARRRARRWSRTCRRTSTTARPAPALEFLSPDQGTEPREHHRRGRLRHHARPRTARRSYDEDVKKQAQQLGLDGLVMQPARSAEIDRTSGPVARPHRRRPRIHINGDDDDRLLVAPTGATPPPPRPSKTARRRKRHEEPVPARGSTSPPGCCSSSSSRCRRSRRSTSR